MLKKKPNKLIAILLSVLLSGLIPAAVTLGDDLIGDADGILVVNNGGNVVDGSHNAVFVSPYKLKRGETKSFYLSLGIVKDGNNSERVDFEEDVEGNATITETPGVAFLSPTTWKLGGYAINTSGNFRLDVTAPTIPGWYDYEVTFEAKTNAQNLTPPLTTATVRVEVVADSDTLPPTATHTLSPNDWTNGNVEITVTAQDLGSGLKSITGPAGTVVAGSTATLNATANGNFTFNLEDNAGNTFDYTVAVKNIDTVKPTATHLLDPESWTNGNVKITVIGDDDASGVESISILNADSSMTPLALLDGTTDKSKKAEHTVSENGNYVFFVNDSAGNSFEHRVAVSNIDTVNPTATHLLDPDSWTNGNVKITVIGDDDASGVKSISLLDGNKLETPLTLLDGATAKSKQAEQTVNENGNYVFLIKDNAGNSSEYPVAVGIIDRNAPTITIGGTVYTGGETVNLGYIALGFEKSIAYTATDDLSGFAPAGVLSVATLEMVDTTAEGMNLSQVLTVTDQAGNFTSITFTYHVISMETLVRLLRPVEMDPSLNIFKKGSTVPIKLQLLDEQGTPSQMSASDLNFVLRHVSGAGTIGTKVKPSPIASFRLSNDGYTYIYNLSTKNLTIGNHVLSIDLESGNGSVGEIGFTLR